MWLSIKILKKKYGRCYLKGYRPLDYGLSISSFFFFILIWSSTRNRPHRLSDVTVRSYQRPHGASIHRPRFSRSGSMYIILYIGIRRTCVINRKSGTTYGTRPAALNVGLHGGGGGGE